MDYGLLGGLAEGVKQGLGSYRDERAYQDKKREAQAQAEAMRAQNAEESALKKRQMQMQMRSQGMMEDESGAFQQTPEAAEMDQLKKQQIRASIAKDLADSRKSKTGGLAAAGAVPAGPGKSLAPDKIMAVSEGNAIPQMLQDLKQTIKVNEGVFGPVSGRMAKLNPWDETSQTMEAQIRSSAQAFGRMMEGGVLRKEDEEKYRGMFPNLSDTPAVAKNKLALVERMLANKQSGNIEALKQQGYSTEGLDRGLIAPGLPSVLTGAGQKPGQGLIPNAVANDGPQPGTIVTVKGVKYRVGADGDSLEQVR